MLLELSQQRLELIPLQSIFFEWVLELVVGVSQLEDLLLVLLRLLVDSLDLCLVLLDKLEIIPSDLIVVILEFSKGLLMILHEFIDMQILALLKLMDLYSFLEFQFLLHPCQFCLVVLLNLEELIIMAFHHKRLLPFMILLGDLRLLDMFLLIIHKILLEVLFLLLHILHPIFIVPILLDLSLLSIFFDVHIGLLLLVLQQF